MKALRNALSCGWRRDDAVLDTLPSAPRRFCLPSPLSDWPAGSGFATGHICIGDLDLAEVTDFEELWSTSKGGSSKKGASFFKPINIPSGYHCLGYYCQANTGTIDGWVLVAKERELSSTESPSNKNPPAEEPSHVNNIEATKPPLASPVDYTLVWNSTSYKGKHNCTAFFWLPCAPDGYHPVGCIVTKTAEKPHLSELMCVRKDLTDECKTAETVWCTDSSTSPFSVWNVYPCKTGLDERGIAVGSFFCSGVVGAASDVPICCLKNTHSVFDAMPNAAQIHALMSNYGPVFYFHPDELYLPSSVTWLFEQGALLYKKDTEAPEMLACDGCNLPAGSFDEGDHWIGLPDGEIAETIKEGDLANAKVYVQVKPMLGGTYTDLVVWIYYPFNGPSTVKLGLMDVPLGKIGEHVSDWEHVTLRISNLSGHLRKVYFAQHSGGVWINASEVEYAHGNNVAVYASKSGHASYPHPGVVLQGDNRVGIGIKNDAAHSDKFLETANNYEIVSAEYLHALGADEAFKQPAWLQYPCQWGPKIQYNRRAELDRVLKHLPERLGRKLQSFINKLPHELSGEQGPTGPMQKNYWLGDERVKHH